MLNPHDPIELAAMMEVDALTPETPPMVPPATVEARFRELEEQDQRRRAREAAEDARASGRRATRDVWLRMVLGPGFSYVDDHEAWVSADGSRHITGETVRAAEAKGYRVGWREKR